MSVTRILRPTGLALALAALLGGGCTEQQINQPAEKTVEELARHIFDHGKWRQQPRRYEAIVEPITITHRVTFEPGNAEIGDDARHALHAFLRQSGAASGEHIEIDGPRNPGGAHAPLTAARLAAIRDELSRTGIAASIPLRAGNGLPSAGDEAEILITRAMVIPPDCGSGDLERGQRPNYRWSCANAANLGHMVANPADLERGRRISPADGEATTLSIQRYRKGEIKPIINEVTN